MVFPKKQFIDNHDKFSNSNRFSVRVELKISDKDISIAERHEASLSGLDTIRSSFLGAPLV